MPKAVSYTLQTLVLADVDDLKITRSGSGWIVTALAWLKDENTAKRQPATYVKTLTAGQQTAIENFLTVQILPGFNTQEGV